MDDLRLKYIKAISDARDENALEDVRLAALGKKGEVSLQMRELGKMTPEELAMVPDVEKMVKQERQKQLREEYEAKLPPRDHTKRNPYSNYTSGLINYSNPGYDSPYFHNGRAHHLQPTNFQETNRGKKIDWSNKYYG